MTKITDWTKDVSQLRKGLTKDVMKKSDNGSEWKETNLKKDILPFKNYKDVFKDMAIGLINYSIRQGHFSAFSHYWNCDDTCKMGAKLAKDLGLLHKKEKE